MAVITYQTPGVYIEEVTSGARPVQAVGTSTAGFLGSVPNPACEINKPIAVNSWTDFARRFMSDPALEKKVEDARTELEAAIKSKNLQTEEAKRKEAQGEVEAARKKIDEATKALQFSSTDLSNAVYGFFLNGGTRCWIVNVGPMVEKDDGNGKKTRTKPPISVGLENLEKVDEVAIVAAPGYTDPVSYNAIRNHCDKLKDRVGILDGPEVLDDNAMNQLTGEEVENANWWMPDPSEYGQLTLYVPWIAVSDPDNPGFNGSEPKLKTVPPSGHVAGVWARSDMTRGVHKAPANEPLRGALKLPKQMTHVEHGLLNKNGVNVIRYFPNEGILVWGARTLTRLDSFRYLNIRRLFNMIEESILESTRWIVFEPNDRPLWQAIRRDVTAFLLGYWRDGALMGRTPDEAFYVKCDEETNPIESIREGRVVIEIGLAPVYPAEFVIFRISQYQAGSEVEAQPV